MRPQRVVLAGLLALASVTVAAPAPAPPARPNLVLVTLDTTRADHLGAWGWPHAHTPNLDALAKRGTRFVRCDTVAPITLVSHSSILTGLYPPRHGVRDNGTFALAPRVETVTEMLRAAGYDTAAVVSAIVLEKRHGLDQGFRTYDDDLGTGYAAGTEESERQAGPTTDAALATLGRLRTPYFLWVHYYDPHEEYRPPTDVADAMQGPHRLYDGEIAYMDRELGRLLRALPPDTVVAVVGDHGEMLGEQGELSHGMLLGHGVRRVPLLLAGPGVPAGKDEDCLVRTVDVAPTLMKLAGLPPRAGLDGVALLPLPSGSQGGGDCKRRSYSESFLPFFAYKWYPLRSLSDGAFLYLQAPRPSLFHVAADPDESRDLAREHPRTVEPWKKRLEGMLAAMGEPLLPRVKPENVLSAEQRAQLESLGYVSGGGGGAVKADLPDPRAMTAVAQTLHGAVTMIQHGRCAEALPELQKIVKQDPHNFPALQLAGQCVRDAGRESDALALFQRAAKENELSAVPLANMGGSYLALGKRADAERMFRQALALDPTQPESGTSLARLLREKGDGPAAIAVLDGVLAAGSHDPRVYLERGTALAEAGKIEPALRDFREAARRSPADPVPLENAAHAAYMLGHAREAVQTYETLLRLAPERGDLWKTLGALYLELGEHGEADRCFRRALLLERDPAERAKLEELLRES
ncbi:MAG TPA: sulfatase-like hydrolase/transferase [Thermoanaerobaculia bacterium]|jgi:arylsulfatase A-like enzyme/Flp pilus assembly protein TadD|nr:sulfatase-like hydrolase/transferase [Thermoanaerobaculia bacterium]